MDLLASAALVAAPPRGAEVRILAPAKINLGLAVLGRRADGYHELRTIFQAVSFCDRLAVRRCRRGVRLRCPALPELGSANLAFRAAELFLRLTGVRGGVAIDLEKRIPAGGGLGGGSSDAAAVLLGCCRLFGLNPGRERLLAWGATLGSDVPFFIGCGAAVGSGRGEQLSQLPAWPRPVEVLIHVPPAGLSTAAVYEKLDGAGLTGVPGDLTILLALWRAGNLRRFGATIFNHLEEPAFALAPGIEAVKRGLTVAGAAGAVLCGSGSSVVGLFEGTGEANRAARTLRGRFPGRWVRAGFVGERTRWGVVKR